ncbi:hypothetical protein [Metabacillus sp. SLBN-84]
MGFLDFLLLFCTGSTIVYNFIVLPIKLSQAEDGETKRVIKDKYIPILTIAVIALIGYWLTIWTLSAALL